jgi:hypothetical protein
VTRDPWTLAAALFASARQGYVCVAPDTLSPEEAQNSRALSLG